jgi:hypothetical protein
MLGASMMLNTAYKGDTIIRTMEIITFFRRPFAICSSSHSPNPGCVGVGAGLIADKHLEHWSGYRDLSYQP